MKKVHTIAVHFEPGTSSEVCVKHLEETVTPLVKMCEVTHLFPKNSSEDLRAMYTVQFSGGDVDEVRAAIDEIANIKLVHISPERRAQ